MDTTFATLVPFQSLHSSWSFCKNITFWYIQASWMGKKNHHLLGTAALWIAFKKGQRIQQTLTYMFAWPSTSGKCAHTISSTLTGNLCTIPGLPVLLPLLCFRWFSTGCWLFSERSITDFFQPWKKELCQGWHILNI